MSKAEALQIVTNLDPETVIDDNWWDYFIDDLGTLHALLIVFGCIDYQELLDKYEGLTIDELLEKLHV